MRELTTTDSNAVANRSTNRALVDFVVLPFLFLTVALLGGLRIGSESRTFIFIAPPLVTLLLAVLLMLLLVRGGLLRFHQWVSSDLPPLTNVAHIWMFITIFFASAQAFNSVLPERGLLHWLFFVLFSLDALEQSVFVIRRAQTLAQPCDTVRDSFCPQAFTTGKSV